MTDSPPQDDDAADVPSGAAGVWPSADYHNQVERLRAAVGEVVYIVELCDTDTQLGVQITDRGYALLGVVDFPRPDPARGLAPHLILLDDGRGLNLGRIARVSRRPFQPAADELLYLDRASDQELLFAERRLSKEFIGERARTVLGEVLGRAAPRAQGRLADGVEQSASAGRPERDEP